MLWRRGGVGQNDREVLQNHLVRSLLIYVDLWFETDQRGPVVFVSCFGPLKWVNGLDDWMGSLYNRFILCHRKYHGNIWKYHDIYQQTKVLFADVCFNKGTHSIGNDFTLAILIHWAGARLTSPRRLGRRVLCPRRMRRGWRGVGCWCSGDVPWDEETPSHRIMQIVVYICIYSVQCIFIFMYTVILCIYIYMYL